jgi:hypothetical protein
MGYQYRPLVEVFREALRTLQNEPGPMIPAKAELMEYLNERIAQHESLDLSTSIGWSARSQFKPPCAGADLPGGYSLRERSRQ